MRIVHTLDYYAGEYGRPLAVEALAAAQRAKGHEVEILVGDCFGADRFRAFNHFEVDELDRKSIARTKSDPWKQWLLRECEEFRPDVIHTHDLADCWAMRDNPIAPVLLSIGVDYRLPPQPCGYEALEMISGADWIEYENPDTAGWYLQAGITGISWNCSLVAIEFDYPRQTEEGLIVSLGRIDGPKKQRLLVEAMPRVLDQCPGARLELVGDGPGRHELEDFSRTKGLEEVVFFPGWASDPAPALSRAQLAAYPSTSMGFDRVVMESMLLGVPVLTSHALAPVTHYGRFGAYAGDRSFAEAIVRCLQDPNGEEKALRARDHALREYSPEAALRRTFLSYERIL